MQCSHCSQRIAVITLHSLNYTHYYSLQHQVAFIKLHILHCIAFLILDSWNYFHFTFHLLHSSHLWPESLPNPEFWTLSGILDKSRHTLKMSRDCPEILDTFWESVKYHRFMILMLKLSELSHYMYELVPFRASQLFLTLTGR